MPKFYIDTTVSVEVECEDEAAALRVAEELETLYLDAARPREARFWTAVEESVAL